MLTTAKTTESVDYSTAQAKEANLDSRIYGYIAGIDTASGQEESVHLALCLDPFKGELTVGKLYNKLDYDKADVLFIKTTFDTVLLAGTEGQEIEAIAEFIQGMESDTTTVVNTKNNHKTVTFTADAVLITATTYDKSLSVSIPKSAIFEALTDSVSFVGTDEARQAKNWIESKIGKVSATTTKKQKAISMA